MARRADGMNALAAIGDAAAFAIAATRTAVGSLPRPQLWLKSLFDVLIGSLPLGLVAGLTIGLVIWLHTRSLLDRTGTGAAELLPTLLAAAVVLELAPVGTGLILASRLGAKLSAELAAMKANEQLDALVMCGVSPMRQLIGPRVLAVSLGSPLLFVLIAATALAGGYLAETLHGSAVWQRYSHALLDGVSFRDLIQSGVKSFAFGWLVAVAGCRSGLTAGDGAEGVGRAATRAVVAAVLLVLLADVVFAACFSAVS